jgi:hypothetical protein
MDRKVHLYVSTTSYQNITTGVVNSFFTSVANNGGTCESPQCMIDYLESLGGLYGNLAVPERLELFNDEQINVTSTVQNVQDISKTFTDFSQSFTIPANDHNNGILQHFYQSDVNALIDYNLRLDSFIEIDLTFFRRGKLQIEKANIKNGRPESYTVTFYGDGRTLKDYFGEDLLSDLDYTTLAHDFSSTQIRNRINGTIMDDVKWPLITSNRIWQYQSASVDVPTPNWLTSTLTNNDIHTTSGAINKNELFPAVRVAKIFDLIEAKYGVTFNGTFLNDKRFTDLFLWYKSTEIPSATSQPYDVDMTAVVPTFTNYDLTNQVDLTSNKIQIVFTANLFTHKIFLNVTSALNPDDYFIDVYQNGNLFNSIQGSGVASYQLAFAFNTASLDSTYSFKLRSNAPNTISFNVRYEVSYLTSLSGQLTSIVDYVDITCTNIVFNDNINLSANAPKMKVADFFSGILKTFNMVCVSSDVNVYDVAPLDDWYGQGAIIDITENTDITSIDVARMPLYKKITFKYADSECLLNKFFSQTYNRNYGDTTYQYNYDGGEFTIDLPFENLLQSKYNGTQNLQLGYSLNSEFSPYIPKPVLLYTYDLQPTNFKFQNDGGGHSTITNYIPFGQDLYYNNSNITLNFAPDTSTLIDIPIEQTLFAQYYFSYLYNLYNLKQRLINVKTILPLEILTGLKLNDRLMIRDKRYIINDMKTNLTTGDVDFSLYLDFRPMINKIPFYNVPVSGGSVVTAINLPNGGGSAVLTPSSSDLVLSAYTLTSSSNITATTPAASSGDVFSIDVAYTTLTGIRTNETIYIVVQ